MTLLSIPDMSCGHCKASVTEALTPLASQISVDLTSRQVSLTSAASAEVLLKALNDIGFPATVLSQN